jgi:hypothetical protein
MMTQSFLIALLVVFIVAVNALPKKKKGSSFWCRHCKGTMDFGFP